MCGRYELAASKNEVANAFDAWIEEDFPKRYNIAPTQPILVVKAPEAYRDRFSNKPEHDAVLVRWGFIPSWTKNPADIMDILKNTPAEELHVFPVSDKINNANYPYSDVKDRISVVDENNDTGDRLNHKAEKQQNEKPDDRKQGKTLKNKDQLDLF